MIKYFIPVILVVLVGCANRAPEKEYSPADMKNFVANCKIAKIQIDFLQQKIAEFLEYHQTHPLTVEDRKYYGRLKNNLWSLRSTCS